MHRIVIRGVSMGMCVNLLFGCATIVNQTTQAIGISSSPTGASVRVDGAYEGKTPVIAKLQRNENHLVRIELEGYQLFETTLTRRVSGWVWGNIAFGGIIGLVIDAVSGGMYKLTPDQVAAELRKSGQTTSLQHDRLYVAVVLAPDPSWEKIGQLAKLDTTTASQ